MKTNAIIEAHEGYVIKGVDPDLYNYLLPNGMTVKEYIENMVFRGWKRWNGDNKIHVNVKSLSVQEMLVLKTLRDGEVYNFHPFIKLNENDINNEIPEGLPNRLFIAIAEYTNEEGELVPELPEKAKTWQQWLLNLDRDNNSQTNVVSFINHEGYNYYYTQVYANGIENITGTHLMIIYTDGNSDVTLVDDLPIIEEGV